MSDSWGNSFRQQKRRSQRGKALTRSPLSDPLLYRRPERGHSCSRSNHYHRGVSLFRELQTSLLHPQRHKHVPWKSATSCMLWTNKSSFMYSLYVDNQNVRRPCAGSREANHEEQRPRRGLYSLVLYRTTATRIWSLCGCACVEREPQGGDFTLITAASASSSQRMYSLVNSQTWVTWREEAMEKARGWISGKRSRR